MVYIVGKMQKTNCYAIQSRIKSQLFVNHNYSVMTKIVITEEAAFIWTPMDGEFDGH